MEKIRISGVQLSILIMGFLLGVIINPSAIARQDAWIVHILAWASSFGLLTIYLTIARLNPNKTLVQILKNTFGKYIGGLISLLYIWYFIHLAAIVTLSFGGFAAITVYTQTPGIFINICSGLVLIYGLRSGLEVIARAVEVTIPMVLVLMVLITLIMIPDFNINNILPMMKQGMTPIMKGLFSNVTFPFGELVVFLMIFPFVNKKSQIHKYSYIGLGIIGFITLLTIVRDLMILGPDMVYRLIFPFTVVAKLFPISIAPIILFYNLVGLGVKVGILIYAASLGIAQVFNLEEFKPFIIPLVIFNLALSEWLYNSIIEGLRWSNKYYAFYALPFQVIIPLILLVISFIKYKKTKKETGN